MDIKKLREIHELVEARYEIRRQAFQLLVARENNLRSELRKIDEQAKTSNQEANAGMRSIGADVIWNRWLGKARASLNTKLALVLAEKEQHVQQVRQAYGKVIAAENMIKEFAANQNKSNKDKMLAQAIETALFAKHITG